MRLKREISMTRFLRTRLLRLIANCSMCAVFLLTAHCSLLTAVRAQTVADKMVATVTNGSRATPDLITYSDLVWQLALEPGTQFSEKPSSANLNRALRLVEDQVLILQEARKLPSADSADALVLRDKEVQIR